MMDTDKIKGVLCQIFDEADHIVGTEAEGTLHKEVAIQDATEIKRLALVGIRETQETESD
jgi:hypothetical protein